MENVRSSSLTHVGFQIFVKMLTGKATFLNVKPKDSNAVVKEKIQEKLKIAYYCQALLFARKTLQDDRTLHYYHITRECTLCVIKRVCWGMRIFVKTLTGKEVILFAARVSTYYCISETGHSRQRRRFPSDQQRLIFMGHELKDERKSLENYNEITRLHLRLEVQLGRVLVM